MSRKRASGPRKVGIQRAYEEPTAHDGYRVLVDHFWPRGRSREVLKLDEWARELAPTAELIHWFGHDPLRWTEFRERYERELAAPVQQQRLRALLAVAGARSITVVYGARSETENQAVVLRDVLIAADR